MFLLKNLIIHYHYTEKIYFYIMLILLFYGFELTILFWYGSVGQQVRFL